MVERMSHPPPDSNRLSDPRPDCFQRLAGAGSSDATKTPRPSPRAVYPLPSTHTSVTLPLQLIVFFVAVAHSLC